MRLYETLFLLAAGRTGSEWEDAESGLTELLGRHGVTVRQSTRYEERKLAYPVEGHRRGTYLLSYLEADPASLEEIQNDLNLSEVVLRSMFVRLEGDEIPEIQSLGSSSPAPERSESEEFSARAGKPAKAEVAADAEGRADDKPEVEADDEADDEEPEKEEV
jgi:small subunit ribosomal protein S6